MLTEKSTIPSVAGTLLATVSVAPLGLVPKARETALLPEKSALPIESRRSARTAKVWLATWYSRVNEPAMNGGYAHPVAAAAGLVTKLSLFPVLRPLAVAFRLTVSVKRGFTPVKVATPLTAATVAIPPTGGSTLIAPTLPQISGSRITNAVLLQ